MVWFVITLIFTFACLGIAIWYFAEDNMIGATVFGVLLIIAFIITIVLGSLVSDCSTSISEYKELSYQLYLMDRDDEPYTVETIAKIHELNDWYDMAIYDKEQEGSVSFCSTEVLDLERIPEPKYELIIIEE